MNSKKMSRKLLTTSILMTVLTGGVIVPFVNAATVDYLSVNTNDPYEFFEIVATDNQKSNGARGGNTIVLGVNGGTGRYGALFIGNKIVDQGPQEWNGIFSTVVGHNTYLQGTGKNRFTTSLGASNQIIDGDGSVTLGTNNRSNGPTNITIGNFINNDALLGENIAIAPTKINGGGTGIDNNRKPEVLGPGNIGIGSGVQIKNDRGANNQPVKAIAIGYDSRAKTNGTIAIGQYAEADTLNGVALGAFSHTYSDKKGAINEKGYNPSSQTTPDNSIWKSTQGYGEISVGKFDGTNVTISRRIANVAAGVLDADAVNVAQLKAVELKIKDDATSPNTAYLNLKNDTLNVGGEKNITTVVSTTTTGSGNATTTEKKITVSLKDTLTGITSITNNTTTKTNGTIITFNDDNISLNTKKITGLTDGALSNTSTDAITGKQLVDKLSNIATAIGGGAEVSNTDGTFTQPSYKLKTKADGSVGTTVGAVADGGTGNTYNNVGAAVTALDSGLAKVINDGLIFSNGTNNITAKLGKTVTLESAGTDDADKLITVAVASDGQDGAKYSLGINTTKLTTKLGTGTIAKNDANLVTGGTVFAALSKKLDVTTYNTDMASRVTTSQLNTALGDKLDASKALFKLAGDDNTKTANINLNVADAPLVQLKGDGEGISVALDGNALKVSANTVKTNADVTNNTNANKLVTASGLTSYAESNYAKLDASNLLDTAGTASNVSEANQKNWGLALSKDANIDTTPANTKGILVTDSQVGQALSNLEIKYKYDNQNAKSVKLSDGFTFKVGDGERDDDTKALKKGLAISVEDDGVITFGLDKDTRDKIDSAIASTNEFIVEAGANTNVSKDDKEIGKIKYTVNLNDTLTDVNSITSKANTNLTLTRNAGSSISLTDSNISLTAGTGADAKTLTLGQDGRLSGISDGMQDTDAVNVRQLNAKTATIQNITKNITQVVNKLEQNSYAGTASAIAAANLPQALNGSSRNVFGISYGTYHGSTAVAMGLSGTNRSRTVVWKLTGTFDPTSTWGVGAGVGFTYGPKHKTSANNSHLEDEISKLKATIENMQKANEEMKKSNDEMKEQYESRITKLENMILELKK